MQEESASPLLRRRKATVVKEDKEEVNAEPWQLPILGHCRHVIVVMLK